MYDFLLFPNCKKVKHNFCPCVYFKKEINHPECKKCIFNADIKIEYNSVTELRKYLKSNNITSKYTVSKKMGESEIYWNWCIGNTKNIEK